MTERPRLFGGEPKGIREATGWQPHSVRGFLTAVVRKKLGLTLVSEKTGDERVFLCWHLQEQAFGGLDAKTAKHLSGPARGGRSRADRSRRLKPGTVFPREYRASGTPSPSLQRAKTAVAVALEILDTEVRWLASTRAMTFTGLKLKASYASIEGALADSIVEDILQL